MSLRTRLLLGLVSLTSVGLLVADITTYTSLRGFLNERVEQQLVAARGPVAHQLFEDSREPQHYRGPGGPAGAGDRVPPSSYPPGTYGQLRGADGSVVSEVWLGTEEQQSRPTFPDGTSWVGEATRRITTGARGSSVTYRVSVEPLTDGRVLIVAIPLSETRQTLGRLFGIMLAVGIAVLLALVATAWWIVRIGLRPLEEIGDTAAHIAAGDLTRRVERAEPRTEVGRLGLALNAMLAQIESAFAERKEAEDKLRRFLADASHELRTPLTSIRGYAELFRRGADVRPDDLAKSMQRIEQEAARMGVLVEDLLVLARLDQRRPLERRQVDIADLAADSVADARAIDPTRSISLDAPPPIMVEADEVRLRQVMANLLTNALEHTPSGSPIEVEVTSGKAFVTFAVIDHGPGLPPEDTRKVFERFYRSDPSRGRGTGGVGLGLAIVAAITQAHGGTVAVEPTSGGGATFRVTMPHTSEPSSSEA